MSHCWLKYYAFWVMTATCPSNTFLDPSSVIQDYGSWQHLRRYAWSRSLSRIGNRSQQAYIWPKSTIDGNYQILLKITHIFSRALFWGKKRLIAKEFLKFDIRLRKKYVVIIIPCLTTCNYCKKYFFFKKPQSINLYLKLQWNKYFKYIQKVS